MKRIVVLLTACLLLLGMAISASAQITPKANTVDYDVDPQELEKLIDSLCDMSRAVNAPGEFE